jgi:peroxiredoxin
VHHTSYTFSSSHLKRPYVLILYRGGWCPYRNAQLADMHLVEPKLRASGFEVLFISTDRPELLYSSLKDQTVTYTLLSDPELRAELPETLWNTLWSAKTASRTGGREELFLMLPAKGRIAADGR